MSSSDRRPVAFWLLLGALGCPEAAPPPLLVPPPPVAATNPIEAPAPAEPLPPGPAPTRVETLDAIVFELGGKAEVRRAGTDEWIDLAVGDAVRVSDEVRTAPDGNLELRFGAARIQVHEGSELALKFLEAKAIRAEVRGLASGSAADGGQLTFEGRGTGVAIAGGGELSLDSKDGRSVGTALSGGARLTAGTETVEVGSGELAIAEGTKVTRPARIGKKVALTVSWPAQAETNQPTLVVKGRASPFSRVLVMGRRVEQGADGAFTAQVPLKRGSQNVRVLVIDPLGRRTTRTRQITFDPNAPTVSGKVEYR